MEKMVKKMLIDATHPEETRVVVADGNKIDEFDFEVTGIDPGFNLNLQAVSFFPGFGLERISPLAIKMVNKDTLIGLILKGPPLNDTSEKWIGFEWFVIQK